MTDIHIYIRDTHTTQTQRYRDTQKECTRGYLLPWDLQTGYRIYPPCSFPTPVRPWITIPDHTGITRATGGVEIIRHPLSLLYSRPCLAPELLPICLSLWVCLSPSPVSGCLTPHVPRRSPETVLSFVSIERVFASRISSPSMWGVLVY